MLGLSSLPSLRVLADGFSISTHRFIITTAAMSDYSDSGMAFSNIHLEVTQQLLPCFIAHIKETRNCNATIEPEEGEMEYV